MARKTIVECDNCGATCKKYYNYWYAAVPGKKEDGSDCTVMFEARLTFTNQSVIKDLCLDCLSACTDALASRSKVKS